MARPRIPIGTHGDTRYEESDTGRITAVTIFRDFDGRSRQDERAQVAFVAVPRGDGELVRLVQMLKPCLGEDSERRIGGQVTAAGSELLARELRLEVAFRLAPRLTCRPDLTR
ncbi:hypothetical protein [Isoptericola sp. NPDC056134]|uniref:hypothetical protein n=1 Tax=Isoptericola sp. NPDC056134 TaxID=3345723 RepID=UPI0035EE4F30